MIRGFIKYFYLAFKCNFIILVKYNLKKKIKTKLVHVINPGRPKRGNFNSTSIKPMRPMRSIFYSTSTKPKRPRRSIF